MRLELAEDRVAEQIAAITPLLYRSRERRGARLASVVV